MLLLYFFAFLSGVVTIFAPCIWPILPIILSASTSGGRRKPLGIVTGIALSFTVFTLSLSYILKIFPFDPDGLRLVAVVVIAFLGVVLLVPAFGRVLESIVSRFSSFGAKFLGQEGSGFGSGFITGFALGIVWSPCAGPILATVAAIAATQTVNGAVVLLTLSFVVGVALPLYLFAIIGKKLLTESRVLSPYIGRIQQVFGAVMILAALAIYSGYDRTLQTKLLDVFPSYGNFLNQFEKSELVQKELQNLSSSGLQKTFKDITSGLENHGPAPEFVGISHWLNTEGGKPLTLSELRGKVVLIDFWTYSCINCIRTLPYVTSWYDKYKDDGFVVVGVHTPEFEFEKKTSNVEAAIKQYKIHYPVAQDNDFATWTAYRNQYWPAHYLLDANGNIREVHFGEGNYAETEKAIQTLLAEAGKDVTGSEAVTPENKTSRNFSETPETYLGLSRMDRFSSPEKATVGERNYTTPDNLSLHHFAFSGKWSEEAERAFPAASSSLSFHFNAAKVFLVLSPGAQPSTVKVFLDGSLISSEVAGEDVKNSTLILDTERLYTLVHLPGGGGDHTLRLEFETPGIAAYAFTFGS